MVSSTTALSTSNTTTLQCSAERLNAKAARWIIRRKCATGLSARRYPNVSLKINRILLPSAACHPCMNCSPSSQYNPSLLTCIPCTNKPIITGASMAMIWHTPREDNFCNRELEYITTECYPCSFDKYWTGHTRANLLPLGRSLLMVKFPSCLIGIFMSQYEEGYFQSISSSSFSDN